tara:strand:- start:445 stop:726 length:282 start_codon:yes stop_codon:yes gene_type:complete
MKNFSLFFGLNRPNGSKISNQDFFKFLKIVDSIFPSYTVTNAVGSWHGLKEDTKILQVTTDNRRDVLRLAEEYKNIFDQEAVGITEANPMEFV